MNKQMVIKAKSELTVLVFTTEYGDKIVGGLGRHVTDLISEGSKRGISYIVITVSKDDNESYKEEDGVHVYRLLPLQKKTANFLDYIRNVNFRFSQFVLQELPLSFDIIHAHDWLTAIAGIQVQSLMKRPLLSTIHATEKGRKLAKDDIVTGPITEYEKELIQFSDRIIVCSQYMRNVLLDDFSYSEDKIEVIPNGIIAKNYHETMDYIDALRTFPFIQSSYIVTIGRLVREKGFELLIQAFAIIQPTFPNIKLVIAGVGPNRSVLEQLARELHIGNRVIFTGFLQELERNTLLKYCEMLVIPSLYEPFGIIALEGMVAKKPVMAFNIGGLSEILVENRGILLNEVSSHALADGLDKYLSKRNQMNDCKNACIKATNSTYNMSLLINDTIKIYRKVLKRES